MFYLLCGALRLARFNVASTYNLGTGSRNFSGFPIPAAAGLISSITLFILWHYQFEQKLTLGNGKYVLVALMIFLSFMMFSKFEYPSFKGLNWRTQFSLPKFIGAVLLLGLNIIYYEWMPAMMFVSYLLYGFLRPFISRAWRREIEDEEDTADPAAADDDRGSGVRLIRDFQKVAHVKKNLARFGSSPTVPVIASDAIHVLGSRHAFSASSPETDLSRCFPEGKASL